MTPKAEMTVRLGVGALLLYFGVTGLLGSPLDSGEGFLRAVQLLVAGYCFWTGYGVWRRQQEQGPGGAA